MRIFAQPAAPPTTPEAACQDVPGTDDIKIPMDSGFVGIFNGTDLKGWWNNCHGEDANHSNSSGGGIFQADPVTHAIYSDQRHTGGGVGSALCTNQKWGNHEIILEYWVDFGNDAGLYHRTTDAVKAYQTVIDYKPGNCVGGSYPQEMESVTGSIFYNCAYLFGGSGTAAFTGKQGNAGIDAKTLVQAQMWDPNGWTELRVKMWGNPPRHQSWMRKLGTGPWVQVLDVTWPAIYGTVISQTGYIALQIHGNGYWNKSSKIGDWYRNIRIRELDNSGNPIIPATSVRPEPKFNASFSATRAGINGWLDRNYDIRLTDLTGKILESFHADSGNLYHAFNENRPQGMLLVEMRAGTKSRIVRVPSL